MVKLYCVDESDSIPELDPDDLYTAGMNTTHRLHDLCSFVRPPFGYEGDPINLI